MRPEGYTARTAKLFQRRGSCAALGDHDRTHTVAPARVFSATHAGVRERLSYGLAPGGAGRALIAWRSAARGARSSSSI